MKRISLPPESPGRADAPAAPDPRKQVRSRRISRIPAFTPVPVRARRDGWTPLRQAEFLGLLAETRCVKAAAGRVGISRESAYRLRQRRGAAGFRAAWDAIVGPPGHGTQWGRPKVSLGPLFQRILYGTYRPVMRAGRYVGTIHKPDNSAVRSALPGIDRVASRAGARRAETKGHGKQKTRSA